METTSEKQGRILLVDDESAILRTFRYCLEDEGYSVATASSAPQAEALLQRQVFDLCFLDLRLGEDNGLDVLAQMRVQAPWMRVVIVTAHSAVDTAVDAMQAGAVDYLVKPLQPGPTAPGRRQATGGAPTDRAPGGPGGRSAPPGRRPESHSPAMAAVLETARQVAATDANILILGESGSGKGELARAIHTWSKRAKKPQVTINCPSLTAELMESELFGHSRGAFTGATESTLGRVSQADGGTLFLDEIGDFPLTLQPAAALHPGQGIRTRRRSGDPPRRRTHPCRDQPRPGRDGRPGPVPRGPALPPQRDRAQPASLRERAEDILGLAERFLARFVRTTAARPRLQRSRPRGHAAIPWPGNVRELRNVIERASIICNQERVDVDHLGFSAAQSASSAPRIGESLSLEDLEKAHITAVMASSATLDQAAKTLGIDASTLYRKRKQYGL